MRPRGSRASAAQGALDAAERSDDDNGRRKWSKTGRKGGATRVGGGRAARSPVAFLSLSPKQPAASTSRVPSLIGGNQLPRKIGAEQPAPGAHNNADAPGACAASLGRARRKCAQREQENREKPGVATSFLLLFPGCSIFFVGFLSVVVVVASNPRAAALAEGLCKQ